LSSGSMRRPSRILSSATSLSAEEVGLVDDIEVG
jgi:hypothetical protein